MGNNSFRKRIAAIVSSILLVFSKSSANMLPAPSQDVKPQVTAEETIDKSDSFKSVSNGYRDFKQIGQDIIPLEEIINKAVDDGCDTMTPQGLAKLDDYLLVTAYDGIEGYKKELKLHSFKREYSEKLKLEQNHEPHNSIILVLDKNNKDLVTTLELPDINHVGGIATDDKNAYIAKSSDRQISVISLDKLRDTIETSKQNNDKYVPIDYDNTLDCGVDASFVTIRNTDEGNQLVIGTWNPIPQSSNISIFDIKNDSLELNQQFKTNSSANGALFVNRDEQEYLLIACSIGKFLDSRLYVYEVDDNDGKLSLNERSKFILPPMIEEIEEITNDDGSRQLAIGSEIFSTRYEINRQPVYPDGIMICDLDRILDRKERAHDKFLETGMKDIINDEPLKKEENTKDKDDEENEK